MITGIDHFVLTVRSVDDTCAFYRRVLGFKRVDIPNLPTALLFGTQKINVHEAGHTFEPKAKAPTPGSADFCLVAARRSPRYAPVPRPMALPSRSGRSSGSAPAAR